MAKSLMSRLILENSNNIILTASNDIEEKVRLAWNENISAIPWETPRTAKYIQIQARIITQLGETDLPTRRQLFKKVIKG